MDKAFTRNLLELCLDQNLQQMLDKSYKDYHVKGFSSIILSCSESLTIRLYICCPGETELNPSNDNILVHNHSFDFQTQVLTGYMENAIYEVSKNETAEGTWYQYIYESALRNQAQEMKLKFIDQTYLELVQLQRVEAGLSYFLNHSEFHRIFVPNDCLVSMLFWQHQKVEQTPIIFSKVPQPEFFQLKDYTIASLGKQKFMT
ncbi:MAG: hypothetical protein HC860_19425 [Alkalinema sp. RU_4_3]|nr:hypothetical protein [Alkalinema sp. RU_4_3]